VKVYTFSEARQRLAALLDQAWRDGAVRIRRRAGQEFVLQAAPPSAGSPLDVPGLRLALSAAGIVALVTESRRSTERFLPPEATRETDGTAAPRPALRVSEQARRPRRRRKR
jgi:antitoxin Phd